MDLCVLSFCHKLIISSSIGTLHYSVCLAATVLHDRKYAKPVLTTRIRHPGFSTKNRDMFHRLKVPLRFSR